MEVIVKARLLLTSALLIFVQIPAPQAQVTVDVVKNNVRAAFDGGTPI
jgi:hypothetical protein